MSPQACRKMSAGSKRSSNARVPSTPRALRNAGKRGTPFVDDYHPRNFRWSAPVRGPCLLRRNVIYASACLLEQRRTAHASDASSATGCARYSMLGRSLARSSGGQLFPLSHGSEREDRYFPQGGDSAPWLNLSNGAKQQGRKKIVRKPGAIATYCQDVSRRPDCLLVSEMCSWDHLHLRHFSPRGERKALIPCQDVTGNRPRRFFAWTALKYEREDSRALLCMRDQRTAAINAGAERAL